MPSTQLISQSGGVALIASDIFSGSPQLVGGVQFKLAKGAPGIVYLGLPNLSGAVTTSVSGAGLSVGGLADGMELSPGDSYFVPKTRLVSGIVTPMVEVPAASSGARLFWEPM